MTRSRFRALPLLCCFFALVACQSSHTQSRMVISDPAGDGPSVIHIRSDSGEESVHVVDREEAEDTAAAPQESRTAETPSRTVESAPSAPAPGVVTAPRKNVYNSVRTDHPVIAITFDDGPHPTLTPRLLDILRQRNIRATFYVVGRAVESYPEIVRRMVAEGHEVANHTWSHPYLTRLGADGVRSEIERTTRAIQSAAGVTPTNMRPPYGATNAALNRRMNEEFGLSVIMWSVDPQDWRYRNASRVSSHIINNTSKGDIILAHDIHASTIDAMPAALDALLAKGFRFLTVSELLEYDGTVRRDPTPVASGAAESPAEPEPAEEVRAVEDDAGSTGETAEL